MMWARDEKRAGFALGLRRLVEELGFRCSEPRQNAAFEIAPVRAAGAIERSQHREAGQIRKAARVHAPVDCVVRHATRAN